VTAKRISTRAFEKRDGSAPRKRAMGSTACPDGILDSTQENCSKLVEICMKMSEKGKKTKIKRST
jgi:hypothetical protein